LQYIKTQKQLQNRFANQRKINAMQTPSIAADPDASVDEYLAAAFLGVSVRTLQAWRVRGGGPRYCKLSRSVRYKRRELIAFQNSRTVESTSDKLKDISGPRRQGTTRRRDALGVVAAGT
jgi:hypothetical protein